MKKWLLASAASLLATGAVTAEDARIGVILGFTGPIESLTPGMAASAELALSEVNDSGAFLTGITLVPERADSTCIDAAAATAAAERLVTTDGVLAIMGADCSGVTGAVLSNVAVPNGVPMISPSATSPALSGAEDNGLFFRTAPSDARQGEVLAQILIERDIGSVAVTYTNNDYGKGFADSFEAAYAELGGEITLTSPHEDGKGDYSAEIGALASAGGDVLVVLGYSDQGGKGMIQAALDTGAFDTFAMGDGMYSDALLADLGGDIDGSFGSVPWAEGEGAEAFSALASKAGFTAESSYTRESYDAAALIALAMMKGAEASSAAVAANVLDVANAPGEPILPGELGKALKIIAEGGEIDYVGATDVELGDSGEAAGSYRYYEITDGAFSTVSFK
ncbi:branched-chain amino acid ABC transporter substrate-binding protein [Salipiger aestuarii]|uniref:Branched-chain amino acid transport system substrate-binding protein n=1 Tax=Salipiger aestuarii TaxID=568098 RepID=A0A327XSY5_9RHOB|nr:ABC transporter substrate-binding protein [Salipiger aestuarii]EIE51623.1 Extracellular ligand-binding receptor precursor [Citreicella sp. 357]KAA8606006.1 branched-chain amino acid ABC transporter substrate-binding protein [Salipiger aestuarii]KAA8607431.1 branched-chain amino acid ABC transporter substrate-binding protein [Salipiger aestuarii]KAB2536926.1 branched-chain amino acid ABC transporter substrate-binding protein [Salipiger aestuarii]RAK10415.1 branched-chain amino acid transport